MESGTEITRFITKTGKTVIVTTLQETDLADLLRYANNLIAEDTFVLLSGRPLTEEYEKKYVNDAIKAMRENKKIHCIARIDGKLVASFEVRVLPLRKSHAGEIGISISPEYRGMGVGKQCMDVLIYQAKKLGLRLLTLTCFAINSRAIHLYESLGFKRAGCIPGLLQYKGAYEDEIIMYLPLTEKSALAR